MTTEQSYKPQEHFRNLKGQLYLEVKHRVTWFRDEHSDGYIKTELVEHDPQAGRAMFKAEVGWVTTVEKGPHDAPERSFLTVYATGYGSETKTDFGDYVEKAETKAVGRALAFLGYGTAQAMDLDEGGSVADSPVDAKPARQQAQPARRPAPVQHAPTSDPDTALRAQVRLLAQRDEEGRSKLPKPIDDMTTAELEKTRDWLQKRAAAIAKGQTTWVDPQKPLRVAGWDQQFAVAPEALDALRTLIHNLLDDDPDMQGIYAAKGITVAEMDEDDAAREFALLKERAERRAQKAAAP